MMQQIQILNIVSNPFGSLEESDRFFDEVEALETQWLSILKNTPFNIIEVKLNSSFGLLIHHSTKVDRLDYPYQVTRWSLLKNKPLGHHSYTTIEELVKEKLLDAYGVIANIL